MATVRITTPGSYQLPAFASRVTVTMVSGAAEAWVTSDGTPAIPPTTTPRTDGSNQKSIQAVVGAQIVTQPPIPNGYMIAPLIQVASNGSPVLELEW